MNTEFGLVARARLFAMAAHKAVGQRRKYTGEEYFCHCQSVANITSEVTNDPEMLAAALLHDTVEDTGVTHEDILDEFGPGVAGLVEGLTDVSKPEDGNRAARKKLDREHTAKASARAQTIKCADFTDNWDSIVLNDAKFARTYFFEKMALLPCLKDADPILLGRVRARLRIYADRNGLDFDAILKKATE